MSLLSDAFIETYKTKTPPWGFNGLGWVVYKRTYARKKEDGATEEWYETLRRCIDGAQKIGAGYTIEEAEQLFTYMYNLKCSFGGRMLWQLGTNTVDRFGANSLLNCVFVAIRKPSDLCFLFENLMLGCGVGFSVRRSDINELPKVRTGVHIMHDLSKDADYIVPDSRQGWVEMLSRALNSYFVSGVGFSYSTILVRAAGEPINGFGGVASGPRVFVDGIDKICDVLNARAGKKLRSIDVLDICNIIGSVVVAGNVRRSAEIALGDADDHLFLRAKRWDLGNIPNHRAMSNNTIYADNFDYISEEVWNGYTGNGEPYGFANISLAQNYGRINDLPIIDPAEGFNPCAEIALESYEFCNLCEIFLNNVESQEELNAITKLLYKTQKAITQLPYIHKESEVVVHRNARIGMGVTGICQSFDKIAWLDTAYNELKSFDATWSNHRGWPISIKLTTVKPSGTLSLLAGATPGVHPAYASYYIRRVRMSATDPLIDICKHAGYSVEFVRNFDRTINRDTVIVEFPCYAGSDAILAQNMTAIDQLELVKRIQSEWSDNAVSVTVYYRPEELGTIKEWLAMHYETSIKSVSFLLHNEHGFDQAPYEEITDERYITDVSRIKPIMTNIDYLDDSLDNDECATGVCPIR